MDVTKILSIVVENVHFLDSLNILPLIFRSIPKSFDFNARGYYPHFNTAENLDYVGSYPEPEYYGADFKSGDERAHFLEWHKVQKGKIFCNKAELEAYCMDDVNVLRQASLAFRNLFFKCLQWFPFGKL
jgi:hypothetical protein